MRYAHGIRMVCDGCAATDTGQRVVAFDGTDEQAQLHYPKGWDAALIAPLVIQARPSDPDATIFGPAQTHANESGRRVPALFCAACIAKAQVPQ